MFAKTAEAIALRLRESNTIDDEHYEICRYGLQQGFSIILNVISTIAIGAMLGMLWQALLFTLLYAPLRSNAGGYHAKTANRCYVYSILMMIAVLLAIKHIAIPRFICIITLFISCGIIIVLAPVEDSNKPLDSIERTMYKKRTYMITAIEIVLLLVAFFFDAPQITYCILCVFLTMSVILIVGKCKDGMNHSLSNVQNNNPG